MNIGFIRFWIAICGLAVCAFSTSAFATCGTPLECYEKAIDSIHEAESVLNKSSLDIDRNEENIVNLTKAFKSLQKENELEIAKLRKEMASMSRTETGRLSCAKAKSPSGSSWQQRDIWAFKFNTKFAKPPTVTAALTQFEARQNFPALALAVVVLDVTVSSARVALRSAFIDESLTTCAVSWVAVGR